jgi:hypothetical protein
MLKKGREIFALIMFANHFNNEFLAGLKYDLGFAFGIKL